MSDWMVTSFAVGDASGIRAVGYEDEEQAREDALSRVKLLHTEIRLWKLHAEVQLNPQLVEVQP